MHVGMEVKKAQKQGRAYTTHKKTILIQEEYPMWNRCIEYTSCIRLVFFCVVISTSFLRFFQLHPYMQRFFTEKLVPQQKLVHSVARNHLVSIFSCQSYMYVHLAYLFERNFSLLVIHIAHGSFDLNCLSSSKYHLHFYSAMNKNKVVEK